MLIRTSLGLLAIASLAINGCAVHKPTITPLTVLNGTDPCTRCTGVALPGHAEPSPDAVYRIDSDLPEMFLSTGVLYSTTPTLPVFLTKGGEPVLESQRRQTNAGFRTIDQDFEVFVYHMSNPGDLPRHRRVVVLVANNGQAEATLRPTQIMESHGTMAKADGPESRLSRRMLSGDWDTPLSSVTIAPGAAQVIGWGPRLSDADGMARGEDACASDFVTGFVRARVDSGTSAQPNLDVAVVAIDGHVPREGFDQAAASELQRGARSGEGGMDLQIAPPACHVRRVVGVFKSFIWTSQEVVLDVSALPSTVSVPPRDGALPIPGHAFLMAAPGVQTRDCPEAQQTTNMLLYPGYVHPDTVGNYQVEYLVTLTLVNTGQSSRSVDIRFGKQDADIGLAWQITLASRPVDRRTVASQPVYVQWAGGWRKDDLPDNTRSLLVPAFGTPNEIAHPGRLTLKPGERQTATLRFMPVGTSSLPFHLHVVPLTDQ